MPNTARNTTPSTLGRQSREEPSYTPDYEGEISFVEHLTDELVLIAQRTVPMDKAQSAALEAQIKRYLNRAL